MRMFIHSCHGVLEATPMTLQAIKDSIPENTFSINEDENVNEPVNEDENVNEPVNEDQEHSE